MAEPDASTFLDVLRRQHVVLQRTTTAERVADVLRQQIVDSVLLPGDRLAEESIADALQVSRNTLREAFRLLAHERLLVHRLNRGVFVRQLTREDLAGLYLTRRLIECGVLREAQGRPLDGCGVLDAVDEGEAAAAAGEWAAVGTADVRFHRAVVALAGNARLDDVMSGLFAELRLVFHTMHSPREFHEPFLVRNRQICEQLLSGDAHGAAAAMEDYLRDAEAQLDMAYAGPAPASPPG